VGKGIDKGRNHVTLKEGFAQSINSVFGKLGAFNLGPKELEAFASKFHFNQPIGFELPVQKSQFKADQPDDPYRLAELASGFNRTTTVSPLHGAMLASAIVNAGRLMEPTVVREVFDRDNRIYYRHEPIDLGRVVSERTVSELRDLMRATIREGTGRKRFHDAGRHPVLSRLDIGGKSGTINDDQGRRVDWFVGFAGTKGTDDTIALAAVVVHGPKMGIRSQELVREAIIRQFTP
jgi:cell division protein FtsI/penicillin-binding protein 2